MLERRSDGTPTTRIISSTAGGPVDDLRFTGSSLGSALVAFLQGRDNGRQVVASSIDGPPGDFAVYGPSDWTRAKRIPIQWDRAQSASGSVTYAVQVDDEDVADGIRGLRTTLRSGDVGQGRHALTVVATDATGQTTTSTAAEVDVDQVAPTVGVRRVRASARAKTRAGKAAPKRKAVRSAGTIRVTTRDGARGQGSGVASVAISWGDGTRGRGKRATHSYRHAGTYRVKVTARDQVGNKRTVVRKVRI
jgi:hypothetical protein